MTTSDPKSDLHRYLTRVRDDLRWKLDGLSEYDVRRPLTPTGTNLLGLLKHVAGCAIGYFGATFDRPFDEPLPWSDDDPNSDMWATADESRAWIEDFYRRAWAHADVTIAALPLDAIGHVPHWPVETNDVTLHQILVHMLDETSRHAGQADIVREMIDGAAGLSVGRENLPTSDGAWWTQHHDRVEAAAATFR